MAKCPEHGTQTTTCAGWRHYRVQETINAELRDELARLRESNAKFEVRFLDQQSESDRLREALEQVTANRDSLLLRIEETEDDGRRLREKHEALREKYVLVHAERDKLRRENDYAQLFIDGTVEAELTKLREELSYWNDNYKGEKYVLDLEARYTELLEAVRAFINVDWIDEAMAYTDAKYRLRQLIEETP